MSEGKTLKGDEENLSIGREGKTRDDTVHCVDSIAGNQSMKN